MTDARPMNESDLPAPPEFGTTVWEKCAETGDYRPIAFEWYKYAAQVSAFVVHIHPDAPGIVAVAPLRWAVLTGLLNRCVRLMFSNAFLAAKRPFRETTQILDRCIFESCVKVMWLCERDPDERLRRFFASSLDTDVGLKREIEKAIAERGGTVLQIERRMLDSIAGYVAAAEVTDDDVKNTKKLPDLKQMLADVGMPSLTYDAFQRQGSHHVHGTWVSLHRDYLVEDDVGRLFPGGTDHPMHINQMLVVPGFLLLALRAFVKAVVKHGDELRINLLGLIDDLQTEIREVESRAAGDDFEPER